MERRYEFRYGLKTKDGLKSCQEITIAKITVQNLANYGTINTSRKQLDCWDEKRKISKEKTKFHKKTIKKSN